ncbi:MAG TPA: tetratricopeptide repeat protein, partial [Bacteroidota bacterium]|nr:tetratricopeptide repeat protein [Bacteroidota bacterium]
MKHCLQNIYVLLIFLLMIGCSSLFAQSGNDTTLYEVLTRAYGLLKIGSPDAQQMFERAAAMDPGNVIVHKQLGYLYHANGNKELALQQLLIADSLQSSDTTKLEIAFWLAELNRKKESDEYFERLSKSQSPDIRQQVMDQLASRPSFASPWYTRIYASPYYDTRWETWFYQGFLQQGYYWNEARTLSAFGFAALSGDARSNGGLA